MDRADSGVAKRPDPVDMRLKAMSTASLTLDDGTQALLTDIRSTVQRCAEEIATIVRSQGDDTYDVGRLIHAMDLLQHAKDVACVAIILPFCIGESDTKQRAIEFYLPRRSFFAYSSRLWKFMKTPLNSCDLSIENCHQ